MFLSTLIGLGELKLDGVELDAGLHGKGGGNTEDYARQTP